MHCVRQIQCQGEAILQEIQEQPDTEDTDKGLAGIMMQVFF